MNEGTVAARSVPRVSEVKRRLVLGLDSPSVGNLALVDSQAKAAFGVGADPSLEQNRGTLLSVVREWDQASIVAFLALRPLHQPPSFRHDPKTATFQSES